MKVLVTVTDVALVDDDFEIEGRRIGEEYLTYELNEWDDYAIEEAVQLSETRDAVEVVTVTVGPERTEETIRQALAKGADRAIRVWDDSLGETDVLDPVLKAELLSGIVEDEAPEMVLTGVQTGDDANGATGVALAQQVGYEWAAVVNQLDVDAEADTAAVHRELEGGVEEHSDVLLPAVFTIQTGINDPRYASLRGIRQAQSKPLDVYTPADVGVDFTALDESLSLTSLAEPTAESDATMLEGDAEAAASQLADVLADSGVVDQ